MKCKCYIYFISNNSTRRFINCLVFFYLVGEDSHFYKWRVKKENREIDRYQKYIVAECDGQVVGCEWLEDINDENADCEVIALYVRCKSRGNGIGKALLQHAMEQFKNNGKNSMIIWCLKDNIEARKFYEKMGGKELAFGTHRWGEKDYDMIAYRYVL
ncbi:MAG: GNAT family N-acetyltransferase [Eubacteriales bacterium]|nr:GNAT family N-acetyltransferase [Eubacteriales bacterium]